MSNSPGIRMTATGLVVMLLAASVVLGSGGDDVVALLGLVGVHAGINLIAAGVVMGDVPPRTPILHPPVHSLGRSRGTAATGLVVTLLAASAVLSSGGEDLVVAFLGLGGVLAGANLIAVGVVTGDTPPRTPVGPACAGAPTTFLRRRNLAVVGLAMASVAVTTVAGDAGPPALLLGAFALLLLGLCLITTGTLAA